VVLSDSFALALMLLFVIPEPLVNHLFVKIYLFSQQLNTVSRWVAVGLLLHSLQSHELIPRLTSPDLAVLGVNLLFLGLLLAALLRKSLFVR
jgi:hypothetical protein